MKRFLIPLAVAGLLLAAFVPSASAGWDRDPIKTTYDSLGVMEISAVGSGVYAATVLDTISTWLNTANGHVAGETMHVNYYEDGGGMYTYCYLYAHMYDSSATTDSNRYYVVLEQAMGGDGTPTEDIYWDPVDSILFNGAVPVGKKISLNGMPMVRFRNQYAAKTDQTDTLTCFVKATFIR